MVQFIVVMFVGMVLMILTTSNFKRPDLAFANAQSIPSFSGFMSALSLNFNQNVSFMKAKFGAIVVAGSGKIGGHVASKNRGGAYFRTKVTPSNPRSVAQLNARSLFTSLSQAWKSLTNDQRLAWNAAVSLYKRTNIFGDLKEPSGINLFQRLNNNLAQIGVAMLTEPPLPSEVPSLFVTEVTAAAALQTLTIAFEPDPTPAGAAYLVRASKPLSPGISNASNQMRVIGFISSGEDSPWSAATEYLAKYGSMGVAGQKIFVDVTPINVVTGQSGTPSSASTIVGV